MNRLKMWENSDYKRLFQIAIKIKDDKIKKDLI